MTDKTEQQMRELIAALFNFTHELNKAGGEGQETNLLQLKRDMQSAASGLWQELITLNDGKGPKGKSGE